MPLSADNPGKKKRADSHSSLGDYPCARRIMHMLMRKELSRAITAQPP